MKPLLDVRDDQVIHMGGQDHPPATVLAGLTPPVADQAAQGIDTRFVRDRLYGFTDDTTDFIFVTGGAEGLGQSVEQR